MMQLAATKMQDVTAFQTEDRCICKFLSNDFIIFLNLKQMMYRTDVYFFTIYQEFDGYNEMTVII
jgi:hypothetical protein